MLQSKNFIIDIWNWDRYCLWDVRTKPNFETWDLGQSILSRDFILIVSDFALKLAEEMYSKDNNFLLK